MKLCIFSDIHGNGVAFEKALSMILGEEADVNIFLGDLCGYYFDEIAIFERLLGIPRLIALKGNHDQMFYDVASGNDESLREFYFKKYGPALEHFLKADHQALLKWISRREELYLSKELDIACYHGSPWDPRHGYVYPDSGFERFPELPYSNIFLGQTHYPMVRRLGEKMIVNPGSLGQPRQGGWPTFAVLDLPGKDVQFKEVEYDKNELLRQMDSFCDADSYLRKILLRESREQPISW